MKNFRAICSEPIKTLIGFEDTEPAKHLLAIQADDIRDEYHTMSELYDHRRALNVALFNLVQMGEFDLSDWQVVKSKLHNDGTMFEGYFIVALYMPHTKEQISYHYSLEHWEEFKIPEVERVPWEYDGHSPSDVIDRLLKL